MVDLLTEEDFSELPANDAHKWLQLQKVARARLDEALHEGNLSEGDLLSHYIAEVQTLAEQFGVEGIRKANGDISTVFKAFELSVARARTKIWASSVADFEFPRVKLKTETKEIILSHAADIEKLIQQLDDDERRKKFLFKRLEDFRREIHQPRTRVGSALQALAPISVVLATSTTTLAQAPDAFNSIQLLLGAGIIEEVEPSLVIPDQRVHNLCLPAPPKQIAGPSGEKKGQ